MEGLNELPQGLPRNGGADDAAKKAQEEQTRRDLLATVLDTGARERRLCLLAPWAQKC
jgi:programmed cell death protein 5